MAKIRLEDVTITFKAIEIDNVDNPTHFLEALGLKEALVQESSLPADEIRGLQDLPAPFVEALPAAGGYEPVSTPVARDNAKKKNGKTKRKSSSEAPRPKPVHLPLPTPEDFEDVIRLRDVVKVFYKAGIVDQQKIIEGCCALKEQVSILKRVQSLEVRIPVAIQKLQEDAENA